MRRQLRYDGARPQPRQSPCAGRCTTIGNLNFRYKIRKEEKMDNKRESNLWKQVDRLIFIIAILGLIILVGAYFFVANLENIDSTLRELILNVITNIIPTSLLFIGAYLVFRQIEKLRSERDADEIADRVIFKLTEIAKIRTSKPENDDGFSEQSIQFSELDLRVHREFEITNKYFDNKSKPQKIIVQFTNRGSNVIHLKKVTYSETGLGMPKSILSRSYRLDNGRDILIPVDQNQSEIFPGNQYTIELCFDEKQDVNKMNGWSGNWGYLHLELIYADETLNLQYSI
jgi:archaellum component FlaF (FlaF/FlaG flagellin family)